MKCMYCKKFNVKPMCSTTYNLCNMFDGGVVGEFSANYGSIYDGDIFRFALCDSCITHLKQEKRIKFLRNYMGS
jgi:hypothetical protein